MSYRTIVVGTDGSPTASVAVEVAQKLAKRLKGKLVLVGALDAYGVTRQPLQTALFEAAEDARAKRVDATAELIEGTPGESILRAAIKHDADLIVVGNRGMGQATRFRLGSVPDWIAHDAPCDLLIVDTTGRAGPREPAPPYMRILAGTDGSGTATEAVRKAYTLASVYAGTVTLVHVGDPLVGAIKLEEVASTRPEDVEVEKRTVEGDPAQRICELAEAENVQLVVVGNKGMSGVRRFLGSVPNKVAHEVPSDVLIVKTVDRSAEDLVAGHGGLVNADGRQLAVYRDEAGDTYELSPRCTHMGCTVDWNDAAKTWDCPCHGSRFAVDGSVVRGPAADPLERVGGTAAARDEEGAEVEAIAEKSTALSAAPAPGHEFGPSAAKKERYAVVGASLAGAIAAATLREEGFDGEVILMGAEPAFPYERPPLSKTFLRGESTMQEAMVRPEAFYADNRIETRFGTTVIAVDAAARTLTVAGADAVSFDKLLIATGARNRRFPIPGINLEGVLDLRTLGDAAGIRAEMLPGRRAVLAGMGFIGSEVAASLRQRGLEVHVVAGGKAPLDRVLGEDVGRVIEGIHRDHGVEMTFDDQVASFEGNGRVRSVKTASGLSLACDFVVLGLGVEPVVDFLDGSGIDMEDGVVVDEHCRASVAGVFAAGDVANHYHPVFERRIRTEHWNNARAQGRVAALNMMGRKTPYEEIHWFWSDQYEHTIQYAGHHRDWDDLVIRGNLKSRSFAAFYMLGGRLQAVVSVDRPADVQDAMGIIRAGGRADPAKLRDEAVPLASLG
ncbi:MAG TPA: FAD-dependent oxidoreductase [Actinomycetota bacterium]|jgi:3-phenylpropionate/trans-cinnamate dioxygenase ferredoxin reductase subunit|nr:FAD-dependent oxidoreductase [Actinomycetota bacterium]